MIMAKRQYNEENNEKPMKILMCGVIQSKREEILKAMIMYVSMASGINVANIND